MIFIEAKKAYEKAETRTSRLEYYYRIGKLTLCLHFAGSALAKKIIPALEHLILPSTSNPDLTIYIWDSVSTGVPFPPFPEEDNGSSCSAVFDMNEEIIHLFDQKRREAIYWTHDPSLLPQWETATPLRIIFQWWMQSYQHLIAHAAVVGTEKGGVLLVGKGGAGKSTTALHCLHAGLYYVGDDYCLLAKSPTPYVYSLYASGKLHEETLNNRLAQFIPLVENKSRLSSEKAFFLLSRHYSGVKEGLPLKAVLVPRITGQAKTTITSVSAAKALKALAPSTIFQFPKSCRVAAWQFAVELVKQLPCYSLNLSENLNSTPPVIRQFIEAFS